MTQRQVLLVLLFLALTVSSVITRAQTDTPLPEGLSALPELVEFIQAEYPQSALDDGVQADVLLEIVIDELGVVQQATPLSLILYTFDERDELVEEELFPEQDPYGFVERATDAVGRFTFAPALDDSGEAAPVGIVWRYGFYFEEEVIVEEVPLPEGETIDRDINLRGALTERGTDDPIVGAEVVVTMDLATSSTRTDENGIFEFRNLAPGQWRVEIRSGEYEPVNSLEEVVQGERTNVSYRVERVDYGEYSYEVRAEAVRREVSRQTLSVIEINRIPGNSGDAIKVVQNLPGVARAPFNAGLIVIRGSAPEDSDIYVEGIEVPLAFHFGGLTSVIPSEILANLEYIPGAFSTEYGRATGGIINIDTRPPRTDGYHGFIDIDVFDTGVMIEGPIAEGWSFFAAGRRSYIDAILPIVLPEDVGAALTVAPRYWDYQAKLHYEPNLSHSLNLFVYGSDDTVEFVIEEPPDFPLARGDADFATGFHRANVEWVGELTQQVTNRAILSVGYQGISTSVGEDLSFNLDVGPLFQFRDTVEIRPFDSLRLRPGLDIGWSTTDISFRAPRIVGDGQDTTDLSTEDLLSLDLEDQITYEPAVFFEAEWDVFDGFTLVPGLRLDYFRPAEAWSLDGRLATRYDLTEDWTLKGAFGVFHQPPFPSETADVFGNPELGLESAFHYVLGAEYDITDFLNVDVQLFYKDLNDLVVSSTAIVERDGELVNEVFNNDGEGRVYGAELLVRHEFANGFFGWLAYTLSFSERRDSPGEDYRTFEFDQTHIFAILGSYDLGRGWSIGGRFRYVTGVPDTPIVGSVYDADSDRYVSIAGEPYSVRNSDFHQLDIRVDKRFSFDHWMFDLYLDVQNVYNHGNVEGTAYNYDYSESAEVTGLPIIPSIGIRGSF